MTALVRFLTHPEVEIDPAVPVPDWPLNETGRWRVNLLAQSLILGATRSVFSSPERKAVQTARPLSAALRLTPEIVPGLHENDRSATGYLPPAAFEAAADAFFADPGRSHAGWETAFAAQQRVCRALEYALRVAPKGDVLLVGHGATGTLLWCALSGRRIDRAHDQPGGGGCLFTFHRDDRAVLSGWVRIEDAIAGRR